MSVIVPVLNEVRAIGRLLDRLIPQLRDEDELLVIDGGSEDGTRESVIQCAEDQRVRLVDAPGTNIPAARNIGIAEAANSVIACTDAGCVPVSGWLEALRAPFAAEDPPQLATGVYRVSERSPFESAMAVACYPDIDEARAPSRLGDLDARLFGRHFDPTMPTGRSVAFTREAWEGVGGFPEELETAEDVSFGRAIARAGGACVLVPDAEVRWDQRDTFAQTIQMYRRYGEGGARSGDMKIVLRDLLRAAAYVALPILLRRRWGRAAAIAGGSLYMAAPVGRALKRPSPARVVVLIPAALATKDLAKAAGCLRGFYRRRQG